MQELEQDKHLMRINEGLKLYVEGFVGKNFDLFSMISLLSVA